MDAAFAEQEPQTSQRARSSALQLQQTASRGFSFYGTSARLVGMDAAFAEIQFNEAGAAEANLAILRTRLSQQLWERLPTLLAQVPSPDDALNFLERYLREAPESITRHLDAHPAALHYLLSLFSFSRFLSESLVQEPELILWLDRRGPNEGLERMKSRDDVLEDCYRFSTMAFDLPPAIFLARFKRREYLRITLRDVLNLGSLSDACLELSNLADVLIERALRLCAVKLENLYGIPQWSDERGELQPARLTVMALGKLGGQELNYSSDIDLIFLYDHDGETAGGEAGTISNLEYFVRLAQAIVKMLSEATPEGAVFRIDMRLRPEGQQGDLAVSYAAALEYYRTRGREWELQMLIKARATAGELSTGERLLRELHQLIYRKELRREVVQAVTDAREEISRVLEQRAATANDDSAFWNVKLSPGGIRDIEFIAQCLQRIHGGRDAWVSGRGAGTTLVALQHLHDKGYLSQRDFYRLSSAYEFLRKVEHRLQLRDGLQEHLLPRKPEARSRIARRSGVEPNSGKSAGEELLAKIRRHFEEVREIYERVTREAMASAGGAAAYTGEERRKSGNRGDGRASLFAHASRERARAEFPAVAERLAHYRAQGDVFARRGMEKYLGAARHDAGLMKELEEAPGKLDCAAALFALSDFAAETLVRSPRAIELIGNSAAQEAKKQQTLALPRSMAALRIAHQEAVFAAGARSILSEANPFETFAELTRAAESAVREALAFAAGEKEVASDEWRVTRKSEDFAHNAARIGRRDQDGLSAQLPFARNAQGKKPDAGEQGLREEYEETKSEARSFVAKDAPHFAENAQCRQDDSVKTKHEGARVDAEFGDAPFVVMALGRLGAGEFDIGSDADVAFFAASSGDASSIRAGGQARGDAEMQEWRRLAERFIRAAGSYTSEGLLLPVDTRLRPRGGEGEIVQPAAYLLNYFANEAQAWEAATYLKARPVAGNLALGEKIIAELREILRRRFCAKSGGDARELPRQLIHMRERLERERAEGAVGFKCAAGGFFDIEYVIAYVALSRGEFAEMPKNVVEQIATLQERGAFDAKSAGVLREAAMFYRSLDHAIRLVLGRSSSTLPEPAQIPRVNALMKQWGLRVVGSLHDMLASTRRAVREVYDLWFSES
jgi:[glutamine synthetase] adenylyltransferase / [glutamine synthetase]-adenylyl-L-tyrosine phosphorylase